jgi:NADH:ubiquinone oxidoreductase subunit F (NADH-binding)
MDFDALVEAETALGTAAVIVMNKQVSYITVILTYDCMMRTVILSLVCRLIL